MSRRSDDARQVFVNCPFDVQYAPLFQALVFAVFDCGFRPRCSLEADDASEVRMDKLFRLIEECRYGVHDISRTELDTASGLPRFNMPFELGVFLGAKRYGSLRQRRKVCLVLDRLPYRYQQFLSDIAGQDICAHHDDPKALITLVRNWLRTASQDHRIPGGTAIHHRYLLFLQDLPGLATELRLRPEELTFTDYTALMSEWLRRNP